MQTANPIMNGKSNAQPWYAHRWPWFLMLGPVLVVIAGVITMWLAFSRQDALVVDDYYKQGKAINQDLRRDQTAAAMDLETHLRYDAAAGNLIGSITSHGKPQSGRIVIRLVHSTQPDKDIMLLAQPDEQGRFSVALPMLEIARWQVLVEGERRDWRLNGVWTWPRENDIGIKADTAGSESNIRKE